MLEVPHGGEHLAAGRQTGRHQAGEDRHLATHGNQCRVDIDQPGMRPSCRVEGRVVVGRVSPSDLPFPQGGLNGGQTAAGRQPQRGGVEIDDLRVKLAASGLETAPIDLRQLSWNDVTHRPQSGPSQLPPAPAGASRRRSSYGTRERGYRLPSTNDTCNTGVVTNMLDDLPAEELAFHFMADRLCLDLAATVGERCRRCFERLRSTEDLGRWLAEAGVADGAPVVDAGQLDAARALRDAIYRAAKLAGEGPIASGDVAEINLWARRPSLAPALTEDRHVAWEADRPVEAALATIARDAIDLVCGPLAGRVRECAADDCALLFVDTSRPGRRRWCSMDACGNRSKTVAYRRRHAAPARTRSIE